MFSKTILSLEPSLDDPVLLRTLILFLFIFFCGRIFVNIVRVVCIETLTGAGIIRAFKKENQFEMENAKLLDKDANCFLTSQLLPRWLDLRLDAIMVFLIGFAALFVVVFRNSIDPGI